MASGSAVKLQMSAISCSLKLYVYERIITLLRVEWRLNSATARFLFMAVIHSSLTFTNTNSHGSHAQKCYNVFIFHYKNYFCCVHGHCVVTFRAIHPQECYCLIQCYGLISSSDTNITAISRTKKLWNFSKKTLTYKDHLENVADGTVRLQWILSKYIGVV
jgi:hypothetical protein